MILFQSLCLVFYIELPPFSILTLKNLAYEAVFVVNTSYSRKDCCFKASLALEIVVAECLRRGLWACKSLSAVVILGKSEQCSLGRYVGERGFEALA